MRFTVAALLLIAALSWAADQSLQVVSVKELPNSWFGAVLSPDGNSVAFESQQSLYVRDLITGRVRQVVTAKAGDFQLLTFLTFVPDGKSLFYLRIWEPPGKEIGGKAVPLQRGLYRIALAGGEPERIAEIHAPFRISPDGEHIAYPIGENGVSSVVLAAAADWAVQRKIPNPGGCVWSPDSSWIAGMAYRKDHTTVTLSTVSTLTGEKRELLSSVDLLLNPGSDNVVWGIETGFLVIRRKGKEYPAGGPLWQYTGGVLRQVTPDDDKYTSIVSASRNGLTLLVQRPALSFWDGISQFLGGPGPELSARELVLIRLRK